MPTKTYPDKWVVNVRDNKFDVYVGRKSAAFGNPFVIGRDGTRAECIEKYRNWVAHQPELIERIKTELRARILGCHCRPQPCHADVLAEIANG